MRAGHNSPARRSAYRLYRRAMGEGEPHSSARRISLSPAGRSPHWNHRVAPKARPAVNSVKMPGRSRGRARMSPAARACGATRELHPGDRFRLAPDAIRRAAPYDGSRRRRIRPGSSSPARSCEGRSDAGEELVNYVRQHIRKLSWLSKGKSIVEIFRWGHRDHRD